MTERAATVEESPFRLEVNGSSVGAWTCSPESPDALAAGWLLAGGFIARRDDLLALETGVTAGVSWASARVAREREADALALRAHRERTGCGPLHAVRCAPFSLRAGGRGIPAAESWPALFEALFALEAARRGGVHAAALSDGAHLLHAVTEVSRHNAADKAIGAALLDGSLRPELGLVLSARVSGEIAWKAARARLSWIASRSIPTTLALEVASAAGLTIVARAASPERVVHRPRPHDAPPLGVIMAGGRNVRFGAHKALAEVGGVRILDRVRAALEPVTGEPVLIANDAEAYAGARLDTRGDARPGAGALSGIHVALLWARELGRPGALVVAGDMPFVTSELLARIAAASPDADAVAPESGGRRGIEPLCAYYAVSCIDALERRLDGGDHRVVGLHEDVGDARRITLDEVRALGDPATLFMNVNTVEELERAEAIAGAAAR